METRLSGSAFQILAAANGKARLPTVESLKGGTKRRMVPEEWIERRPDTIGNAVDAVVYRISSTGSVLRKRGSNLRIYGGRCPKIQIYFLRHKTALCFRCFIALVRNVKATTSRTRNISFKTVVKTKRQRLYDNWKRCVLRCFLKVRVNGK